MSAASNPNYSSDMPPDYWTARGAWNIGNMGGLYPPPAPAARVIPDVLQPYPATPNGPNTPSSLAMTFGAPFCADQWNGS